MAETAEEVRTPEVGDHVVYVDEHRQARDALVLIVWQQGYGQAPGVNLVTVETDPEREDSYGRQIVRETSVVHQSQQPAGGLCWRWPEE